MTLTAFPNGVSSFGVPVIGGGSGPFKPYATYYFVDANNFTGAASDGNDGLSPQTPLLTMARCFAIMLANVAQGPGGSGSVICFIGNIREQLTSPAGVFDVTIMGGSNSPRNADAFTAAASGDGGRSGASWLAPASPTASTPLLKIQQQGWVCQNFLFGAAPAATASVQVFRDGGAGSLERDGSHAAFYGMRFDSSPMGIQASGGPAFLTVSGCLFARSTTTAIANVTGAGIGTNLNWNIVGNRFTDNVNHIVVPGNECNITNNVFGKFTTLGVSMSGGTGSNQVHGNYMSGDYDAGYVAASNDDWCGNYSMDLASDEVGDNGITTAVPVP